MSRVGKTDINLPSGVTVTVNGRNVEVKGSKGTLTWVAPYDFAITVEENVVKVAPSTPKAMKDSAMWGTTRALIANMVKGVSEGYTINMKLIGVGYRANMAGPKLNLSVGYSHPVLMDVPAGIAVAVNENTEIVISGADKQAVGQFAAKVRDVRPPEPFKGKGIRYANEYIAMKEGKKK